MMAFWGFIVRLATGGAILAAVLGFGIVLVELADRHPRVIFVLGFLLLSALIGLAVWSGNP